MKWKTIKNFSNRIEAELAKGLLEANDINANVRSDDAGGTRPSLAFASGVELQVLEKDVQKAKELIKEEN